MINGTRYEIMVEIDNVKHMLDTYDIDPIDITKQVNDIKDISVQKASFSKTISLPETSNNRKIFGFISDLSADSSFNPNLKSKAWIFVGTIETHRGYLQLKKISIDKETNQTKLEVVIFAENKSMIADIGEKYLTDLVGISQYNHIYSTQSVMYSWTQSYTNGYYYSLKDRGSLWNAANLNSGIDLTYLFPDIYVKTYFDMIIAEAGYTYDAGDSGFLDDDEFCSLVIPNLNAKLSISPTYSQQFLFRASVPNDVNLINTKVIPALSFSVDTANYMPATSSSVGWFGSPRIPFTDTTTSPNGDPNGVWNTTSLSYHHPIWASGKDVLRFGGYIRIIENPNNLYTTHLNQNADERISLQRSKNASNTALPNTYWAPTTATSNGGFWAAPGVLPLPMGGMGNVGNPGVSYNPLGGSGIPITKTNLPGGLVQYETNYSSDWMDPIYSVMGSQRWAKIAPGEEVALSICRSIYTTTAIATGSTIYTIGAGSYISVELLPKLQSGQVIDMTSAIPKNVKQKDFILWIQKMFNLVFIPSTTVPNHFTIEPLDQYLDSGQIVDWSGIGSTNSTGIDLNEPIDQQILGETQNRSLLLTYKIDKDYYNTLYQAESNAIYGELKTFIDNDFIKGEKKIDIGFSPTPLSYVPGSTNFVMPIFTKDNAPSSTLNFEANIRILRRTTTGTLPLQGADYWRLKDGSWTSANLTYTPYIGHLDNPFNPTDDINFGQTIGLYYPNLYATDNNLFRKHYYRSWAELTDKDSRIVTAKFYLTPADIYNFKFNHKIYLDFEGQGQYYRVNKITGYDPTRIATCTVELIKTKFVTVPKVQTPLSSPLGQSPTAIINTNNNNVLEASRVITTGETNVIGANDAVVIGSNNRILSPSIIQGDGNNIDGGSEKVFVVGNNNQTLNGVTNSFSIGSNLSIEESDTIILANTLIITPNEISAGRDEVLNPFSDNWIPNEISAGRDAVRELGSETTINVVNAGRNTLL